MILGGQMGLPPCGPLVPGRDCFPSADCPAGEVVTSGGKCDIRALRRVPTFGSIARFCKLGPRGLPITFEKTSSAAPRSGP